MAALSETTVGMKAGYSHRQGPQAERNRHASMPAIDPFRKCGMGGLPAGAMPSSVADCGVSTMAGKGKMEQPGNAFSWNVVCDGFELDDALRKALQRELPALAQVLQEIPPEEVHLHVAISRSKAAGDYFLAVTLRLPETVLQADESAANIVEGMRAACASLRDDALSHFERMRAPGDDDTPAVTLVGFGPPLAAGKGPQSKGEAIHELFERYYPTLLRYARRRVRFHELGQAVPRGFLDPMEIVDEAAARCLGNPKSKPPHLGYRVWFHRLVRDILAERCRQWSEERRRRADFPEAARRSDEEDPDQALENDLNDDERLAEDELADSKAGNPEEAAEESELVNLVLDNAQNWPALEREIFTLHFLEGFEPEEVAQFEGLPPERIREILAQINRRLRGMLRDEPPG